MRNVMHALRDRLYYDLAIDLGSTNTLIYQKGAGIVVDEPSVVAVGNRKGPHPEVIGVGAAAKELITGDPVKVREIKPVRHGVITDFNAARIMLGKYLERVQTSWFPRLLRVVANVPAQATAAEKTALRTLLQSLGAREVYLLEEPRALTFGAGVDISQDHGTMAVDIGGGITEMSVIAEGRVVSAMTIPVGGEFMDQAISGYVRTKYGLDIDGDTAERLKISVGTADPRLKSESLSVEGKDSETNQPVAVKITSREIYEALSKPISLIIEAMQEFIASLAPKFHVDIIDRGMTLAGGGVLLPHLDRCIERETSLPVFVTHNPLACLVLGSGDALNYLSLFRQNAY